jgi:hypothetical protein
VGIADGFVLHRSQAEALDRIVACLLEPAVIESQGLGLPVFKEQLAVVGALEPASHNLTHLAAVEAGAVDEGGDGGVHSLLRKGVLSLGR